MKAQSRIVSRSWPSRGALASAKTRAYALDRPAISPGLVDNAGVGTAALARWVMLPLTPDASGRAGAGDGPVAQMDRASAF